MKLDIDSVEVLDITGVTYTYESRAVTRHRQTDEEGREDFGLDVADVNLDSLSRSRNSRESNMIPKECKCLAEVYFPMT